MSRIRLVFHRLPTQVRDCSGSSCPWQSTVVSSRMTPKPTVIGNHKTTLERDFINDTYIAAGIAGILRNVYTVTRVLCEITKSVKGSRSGVPIGQRRCVFGHSISFLVSFVFFQGLLPESRSASFYGRQSSQFSTRSFEFPTPLLVSVQGFLCLALSSIIRSWI
jgi:hypothetical protein